MLKELSIRNFAIIDDLKINFSAGLTILSGETGAGKSIILNAVNLLLGTRASADLVRTGAETAELEGLFQISQTGSIAQTLSVQAQARGIASQRGKLVHTCIYMPFRPVHSHCFQIKVIPSPVFPLNNQQSKPHLHPRNLKSSIVCAIICLFFF